MVPETRFARCGDLHIAYQVVGEGPFDLVYVPGWVSNVELAWEDPWQAAFLGKLASFSRLVMFDKRGTGLSDSVPDDQLPTLEQRVDDLTAVLDAVGSRRAALFGISEGGNLAILFAAMHPERTTALITFGSFAKRVWSLDYPWAPTPQARALECEHVEREWGRLMDLSTYAPGHLHDQDVVRRLTKYFRQSASPSAAVALLRMNTTIDVRSILPTVHVPTLVLHRKGDRNAHVDEGRYIAERVPGARFVELEGDTHFPWLDDQDSIIAQVQEFLTGDRPVPVADRVLVSVLFIDIAESTGHLARLGDSAWRELQGRFLTMARKELVDLRGREVDAAGDGLFATFDGPARAVTSALRIQRHATALGLGVRAGVHTGEVELAGGRVTGIAVHIGARVCALAASHETLVTGTVKDLVSGSGLRFDDRGTHALKGVPDPWRVFAAS